MSKKIVDKSGLFPKAVMQESKSSFILHEHPISMSGLKYCSQAGITPFVVSRSIGFWGSVRNFWIHGLLNIALKNHAPRLIRMVSLRDAQLGNAEAAVNMPDLSTSSVWNLDMNDILCNRCGFPEDLLKSPAAMIDEVEDITSKQDQFRASNLIASLAIMSTYSQVISGMIEAGVSFTNKEVDDAVKNIGIGATRWHGDRDFFGWNGKPKSLKDIDNLANLESQIEHAEGEDLESLLNETACRQVCTGVHLLGIKDSLDGKNHTVSALLSSIDDKLQDRFREMNWHLTEDEFQKNPYTEDKHTKLYSSKKHGKETGKLWFGQNCGISYLLNEGITPEIRLTGGVLLSPQFDKFIESSPLSLDGIDVPVDVLWVHAIGSLATRMMSSFGYIGANILNYFQSGYMVMPSLSQDGFSSESEFKAARKRSTDPFYIEPVYSMKMIKELDDKANRDAFLKIIRHNFMEGATDEEVAIQVDRAMSKLFSLYNKAEKRNWMDEKFSISGAAEYDEHGGKLDSENEFENMGFLDALDRISDNCEVRWVSEAKEIDKFNLK